jgi:NAD-dependent SIR2 family protein deacetylase
MEDTLQHFDCESCGAEFAIKTDMDIDPQWCPYCGEVFTPFINISMNEDIWHENSGTEGEG